MCERHDPEDSDHGSDEPQIPFGIQEKDHGQHVEILESSEVCMACLVSGAQMWDG